MDVLRLLATFSVCLSVCVPSLGCQRDAIQVQPDFQLEQYMGKWYEQKWLAQSYIPADQLFQDYTHRYSLDPDRQNVTVYVSGRDPVNLTTCFHYRVQLTLTDVPGKFLYPRGTGQNQVIGDYWVIKTDYTRYALVFGCREWGQNDTCVQKDSWVWSRTPTLDTATMEMIDAEAANVCINVTKYLPTSQTNECSVNEACYMDAFEPVQNFDLQRYVGRWYEQKWLAAVYIPDDALFQDYQHYYAMQPDGTITVYIRGRDPTTMTKCFYYTAKLIPTATPGKLIYRRNIGGTIGDGDYWVVSTDYDQYALVYGCRERNDTGHCVQRDSWIWSRAPTTTDRLLNQVVSTAVENLCVSTDNYLTTQQNRACPDCFVPLIGMNLKQNLNLTKFAGVWFRRYHLPPKGSLASDVLKDLRQSIVQYPNGTLEIYLSARDPLESASCFHRVDQLWATDDPAKFTYRRVERKTAVPITTDFWVLDTDYDNYAVTYGCRLRTSDELCDDVEASVWVRDPAVFSRSSQIAVRAVLEAACLDLDNFTEVQHGTDCVVGGAHKPAAVFLILTLLAGVVALV